MRKVAFKLRYDDACVLRWTKQVLGCPLWSIFYDLFVKCWANTKKDTSNRDTVNDSEIRIQKAIDAYNVAWLVILILLYTASWIVAKWWATNECVGDAKCVYWLVVPVAILALFRVLEVLSVYAQLHLLKDQYETQNRGRALMLLFVDFCQVCFAFGTLYLSHAFTFSDPFTACKAHPIGESWEGAIYYSTVTITTLGYGDFAPSQPGGKVLVMVELGVGIVLLGVGLQRGLASENPSKKRKTWMPGRNP